ncbi:MAG: hypothetical protein NT124_04340 [Candidatus Dependentiae bacterium]|nr:hypothetical protein [Candidatus Dependentiae bacterium]
MDFVKLALDPNFCGYSYDDASNVGMTILGRFLRSDVGGSGRPFFREWALESIDGDICGGNITILEKVGDDIVLADEYSDEPVPTKLKMTTKQFVLIFDEWQKKVVKLKPKEVIIKYENDQFFIETYN